MGKSAGDTGKAAAAGAGDWNDLRHALALARGGSLAAAAELLGVDATTVSRRLRALEEALGTPLFERNAGRMQPTGAGERLLERGARIEAEFAALAGLAEDLHGEVRGLTRITAIDSLVTHALAPRVGALRVAFPDLDLELIGTDRNLDLARREADIALRLARPEQGDLVIRRLSSIDYAVYAGEGIPLDPTGWERAPDWVAYEVRLQHVPEMRWLAQRVPSERVRLRSNNLAALCAAVAAGVGHAVLPRMVGDAAPGLVRRSSTVPVLSRDLWLVVHRELRDVPRVRVVCDWLVENWSRG